MHTFPRRTATSTRSSHWPLCLASRKALDARHCCDLTGISESIELARASEVRVEHIHLAINNPALWGTVGEQLEELERARAPGVDILCDVYPYAGSLSALIQHLPLSVQSGGTQAMRHRSPIRARALVDMTRGWAPAFRFSGIGS